MRRAERPPLTVIVTARAGREIDDAAMWWAERGEPTIVDDAVAVALRFVDQFPEVPPLAKLQGRWTKNRRASVDPLGYNLFYRYDAKTHTVVIRCFRHQSRRPPRL